MSCYHKTVQNILIITFDNIPLLKVPYFLERAPGALIKKSDFLGGRFFEVGALSRGGANLKVGLFWGALFRGGHLIFANGLFNMTSPLPRLLGTKGYNTLVEAIKNHDRGN